MTGVLQWNGFVYPGKSGGKNYCIILNMLKSEFKTLISIVCARVKTEESCNWSAM